ncbi:MAG: TerC/Alx family metal homeostasis membrane protein [Chlamydiales bacterium]|nr:TerC/Alx family metal homeostasis membrane protein [Chlamydiales bacterium]
MFNIHWWIWFNILLFALLYIDLRLFPHRGRRQAYALTVTWVSIALAFAGLIYVTKGATTSLEFLTGYVIEESLSIDNLFVFLMLFQYFHVPSRWQSKILMYGIVGALVMRLIFILVGISLVQKMHWLMLVFGAFLVVTGAMMFKKKDPNAPQKQPYIVSLLKKYVPFTDSWEHSTFFIKEQGRRIATPAFLVVCAVESTDLLFALDSIPAIFGITLDPFVVYSCNALAIVGLRSLFFVLKDALTLFEHLHYGVSLILVFIGGKMLVSHWYKIDTIVSLSVVGALLIGSLLIPKKKST